MKSAKRLELIITNDIFYTILEILDKYEMYYTVFDSIKHKSNRKSRYIENEFKQGKIYIILVCSELKLNSLLEDLNYLLKHFDGIYFVQDTMVWEHSEI